MCSNLLQPCRNYYETIARSAGSSIEKRARGRATEVQSRIGTRGHLTGVRIETRGHLTAVSNRESRHMDVPRPAKPARNEKFRRTFHYVKKEPQDTAAEIVLNRMVQVVASPTRQAFRQADMHTASLGRASGLHVSAQEHFRLANIPGTLIIGHKPMCVAKGKTPELKKRENELRDECKRETRFTFRSGARREERTRFSFRAA